MEVLTLIEQSFLHPDPANLPAFLLVIPFYILLGTYVVWFVYATFRLLKLTFVETFIASRTKPFTAPDRKGEKRILILGDSTAVGAGAKHPADSIAGRLAYDFPHAYVVNLGINGARTRDVLRAIASAAGQQFELVIISTGGNDIWHFSRLKRLGRDLRALIQKAKVLATGPVILLLYNNVGSSPIFPSFMRRLLKPRGEAVQALFRKVATEENVPCIELFSNEEDNPFLDQPRQLFSSDGVHPSSEGYRLWYNRMWRLLVGRGYTF